MLKLFQGRDYFQESLGFAHRTVKILEHQRERLKVAEFRTDYLVVVICKLIIRSVVLIDFRHAFELRQRFSAQ